MLGLWVRWIIEKYKLILIINKKQKMTNLLTIPLWKYMTELQTKNVKTKFFLQNWNAKARNKIQNRVKNLHKNACKILEISAENYTTHCWRRSATTNLADRGVSFINLKRHGQWKSDSIVKGYIANSEPMRKEREICLLPASLAQQEGLNGTEALGLVQ